MKKIIITIALLLVGAVATLFSEVLARINARRISFKTLAQHNDLSCMETFTIGYNAGHLIIVTHGYEGGGVFFEHDAGDGVDHIIEVAQALYSLDLSMEIWQIDLICCFPGDQWGHVSKKLGNVPIVPFSTVKNPCLVSFEPDGVAAWDSKIMANCYSLAECTGFLRFYKLFKEHGALAALKMTLFPPKSIWTITEIK